MEYEEIEDEENENQDENDGDLELSFILGGNNNNNIEIIENNDSHSESGSHSYQRNLGGLRFHPNLLRRGRNSEIEIRHINNNHNNNDDYALFYNPFLENNNQSSIKYELELYYEESVYFPFNIYKYKESNSLFLFYRPSVYLKTLYNKSMEMIENTTNIFLYNYIYPFDNNYKRYFTFALIGAKEKTVSYYIKEVDKIKDTFNSICNLGYILDKKEKLNIIKKIRSNILDNNSNIKKLENKDKVKEDIKNEKKEVKLFDDSFEHLLSYKKLIESSFSFSSKKSKEDDKEKNDKNKKEEK